VIVKEAIRSSMRKISALSSGQEPTPQEYKDCLEALNLMLDSWSADIAEVFSYTREEFTMTPGTAEYTIGDAGDFDTVRPKEILSAFVQYPGANNKYGIDVVGQERYDYQNLANTPGRPRKMYYNPTYPLGTLFFYYSPNAAFTLTLKTKKALGVYTSINDEITLPQEYNEAIVFNLILRISDEFGFAVPNDIKRMAKESINIVKKLNFNNLFEDANLDGMLRKINRRTLGEDNIYG